MNNTALPLQFWLSTGGTNILTTAKNALHTSNNDTLKASTQTRKTTHCSPNEASEALEITLCREKAAPFGEWTQHGFFTRQSLEQATAPHIAQHHAKRFKGCRHVLEICTGAGFDTAALAHNAAWVTTIEANERLAAMARHNLSLQGITNVEVVCGLAENVMAGLALHEFDGLWSDPSRRTTTGARIHSPDDYAPSLQWLQRLNVRGVRGIKIAPAVNCEAHHLGNSWLREWIGYEDECREQVLWSGLEGFSDNTATLVYANGEIEQWRPQEQSVIPNLWNGDETLLAGMFVLEPHPALIRTGHLAEFAAEHGFMLLDGQIAYLISPTLPPKSAWYETFAILEAMPFHYARLKERLQSRLWGNRLEIKKRGFPETPEEIRKKLKLAPSPQEGVLICTRKQERHWAILAQRL